MATFLKEKGWYLTENGVKKLTELTKNNSTEKAMMQAALDCDLREIGGGFTPASKDSITVNVVLQVLKVRNVSAPKSNEESKAAPKMLKIQLTDGQSLYTAVEIDNITSLTINTPPGTKVLLKNGPIKIAHGMLLLLSKNIEVLGGLVASLVEKWEVNRSLAKYAKGGRMNLSSSGPPRWIAFGKEIPNMKIEEHFNSLVEAQAKITIDTDNSEFKSQRTEVISAIKTENKKVFGGGTKQLVDANVQKIIEKGYTEEQAKTALRYNKNNVELSLSNLRKREERTRGSSERNDTSVNKSYMNTVPAGSKSKLGVKNDKNDRGENAKPSTKISLFEFFEDKLPSESQENYNEHVYDGSSFTGNKRNEDERARRFENNISTSFANRGKRYNAQSENSRAPATQHQNRFNNREYNVRNNDVNTNNRLGTGREYHQNNRYDNNNRQDHCDRGQKNDYYRQKENDRNQRQDHQRQDYHESRGRRNENLERSNSNYHNNKYNNNYQQSNQTRDKYSDRQQNYCDSSNYSQQEQQPQQRQGRNAVQGERHKPKVDYQRRSSPHGKALQTSSSHNSNSRNVNQITEATANLKINPENPVRSSTSQNASLQPHQKTTTAPNKSKPTNYSHPQPTSNMGTVVSHAFNPYHVIGLQRPQPQVASTVVVPISTVPVMPSAQPNPHYPPPPPTTAVFPISNFQISITKWNVGDVCLAKYWEDGRFYPAEITGLSENTNVVRFVDYGNFEEVLKGDCLPITASGMQLNPQQFATRPAPVANQYKAAALMPQHQMPSSAPNATNRYHNRGTIYIPPPAQRR